MTDEEVTDEEVTDVLASLAALVYLPGFADSAVAVLVYLPRLIFLNSLPAAPDQSPALALCPLKLFELLQRRISAS